MEEDIEEGPRIRSRGITVRDPSNHFHEVSSREESEDVRYRVSVVFALLGAMIVFGLVSSISKSYRRDSVRFHYRSGALSWEEYLLEDSKCRSSVDCANGRCVKIEEVAEVLLKASARIGEAYSTLGRSEGPIPCAFAIGDGVFFYPTIESAEGGSRSVDVRSNAFEGAIDGVVVREIVSVRWRAWPGWNVTRERLVERRAMEWQVAVAILGKKQN